RTVGICSPGFDVPRPAPAISSLGALGIDATALGTTVTITGSAAMPDFGTGFLTDPSRFTLEISHSALDASVSADALEWQREISVVGGVAATQPALGLTLFTFDMLEDVIPDVRLSTDQATLYLDFPKPALPFDPWMDGKLTVMLDPGHGEETPGKRSPDGTLLEYEFNRDMASRIKRHLERHGIEVLLTVEDNTDVPLAERCKKANESDADIFVSVHANAYGDGWNDVGGWEIYVYRKGSYSERLAKAIQDASIPASGLTDRGLKANRLYVVRNVNMPAVLIEHAFYTNRSEVELLKSPEAREAFAIMDVKGMLQFLNVAWIEP
ncbi:MAG: N-acetylmuramoyl-L-alanine amidase, partial [Clostridiales Family XIII bacterium]|nr:N-acetylmuramoyl-L-alanine amidase [Clostridiales Family XIII bacterium]